ncbi:MAG: MFS transporter, partial [Vulcanisaeta sp.]
RLSDIFGRRTILLNVLLFFVLGSIISAIANSVLPIILGRFLVGVGIGGDIPSGASLIAELSKETSRGRLISIQSILWGPWWDSGCLYCATPTEAVGCIVMEGPAGSGRSAAVDSVGT